MSKKKPIIDMMDISLSVEESKIPTFGDSESSEFGLTTFNFSINYMDDESKQFKIGELSIIKADFGSEDFDPYMILDLSGSTEPFCYFVDEYGISDKVVDFYSIKMDYNVIFDSVMFIIDRLTINEEYRGSNIGLVAIKTALKALNLNYMPFGVFINPFPLQFENNRNEENSKQYDKEFKAAQKKLIKYYKKLDFTDKVPFKADMKFMFADSIAILESKYQ